MRSDGSTEKHALGSGTQTFFRFAGLGFSELEFWCCRSGVAASGQWHRTLRKHNFAVPVQILQATLLGQNLEHYSCHSLAASLGERLVLTRWQPDRPRTRSSASLRLLAWNSPNQRTKQLQDSISRLAPVRRGTPHLQKSPKFFGCPCAVLAVREQCLQKALEQMPFIHAAGSSHDSRTVHSKRFSG